MGHTHLFLYLHKMIKNFRSPFLFHRNVPNHKRIKEDVLPKIKSELENKEKYHNVGSWNAEVYTSFNYRLDFLHDPKFIDSVIWDSMDQMVGELLDDKSLTTYPKSSNCKSIWFNYYEPGGFQEVHDHLGESVSFSGIYLLHVEEPNTTFFYNPNSNSYLAHTINTKDYEEGSVLIFPSSLLHYVNPVKDHRYTISFNIVSNF
jgi:hypothetical protein